MVDHGGFHWILEFQRTWDCPKVDVFAAGVILYFMLRGKLPFSAETQDATLELLDHDWNILEHIGTNYIQLHQRIRCMDLSAVGIGCDAAMWSGTKENGKMRCVLLCQAVCRSISRSNRFDESDPGLNWFDLFGRISLILLDIYICKLYTSINTYICICCIYIKISNYEVY